MLNVAHATERVKDRQLGIVQQLPGIAAKNGNPVPKMTYLEKPLGTTIAYGHRQEDDYEISMDFFSVYKPGKKINISLSGPKAAIEANEKIIYDWLARFKFLP